MTKLEISEQAKQDLVEIWSYIAPHNLSAADRLIRRFDDVFQFLAGNPKSGSPCDRYAAGLRVFSVGNYAVFFQEGDSGVTIIRVLHGARHLDDLFGTTPNA